VRVSGVSSVSRRAIWGVSADTPLSTLQACAKPQLFPREDSEQKPLRREARCEPRLQFADWHSSYSHNVRMSILSPEKFACPAGAKSAFPDKSCRFGRVVATAGLRRPEWSRGPEAASGESVGESLLSAPRSQIKKERPSDIAPHARTTVRSAPPGIHPAWLSP
jgi:hypothetical protein